MKYDILLVGSGLFSSVIAYKARQDNKKCLIIEKRSTIGGNLFCEDINNTTVHKYGPHIFHTNDWDIWKFVNELTPFNTYQLNTLANYKDNLYTLPFNLLTFKLVLGEERLDIVPNPNPKNLEEKAISSVGIKVYETLIKGYTEKQWGRSCKDLPADIINRIPVRNNYNCNYFNDKYQGIPEYGYNALIKALIKNTPCLINTEYTPEFKNLADIVIYTGPIDLYFDYSLGKLEYRSLVFKEEVLNTTSFQGNAIINYTDVNVPYTRIIEHKYFTNQQSDFTVITKEFPSTSGEPYYPINDLKNNKLFNDYISLTDDSVLFGGRLGSYSYLNMDQVIKLALECYKYINGKGWNKTLLKN